MSRNFCHSIKQTDFPDIKSSRQNQYQSVHHFSEVSAAENPFFQNFRNWCYTKFESALKNRNYPENVIFHSDRGSQYTSDEFRKRLDRASFIQSFSKKGHPYDNAVAEAFFKFLKLEETNRRSYTSLDELELSVFEYIHFYNFKWPHSANELLSPVQFEDLF